jgi:hypothetical protein
VRRAALRARDEGAVARERRLHFGMPVSSLDFSSSLAVPLCAMPRAGALDGSR